MSCKRRVCRAEARLNFAAEWRRGVMISLLYPVMYYMLSLAVHPRMLRLFLCMA